MTRLPVAATMYLMVLNKHVNELETYKYLFQVLEKRPKEHFVSAIFFILIIVSLAYKNPNEILFTGGLSDLKQAAEGDNFRQPRRAMVCITLLLFVNIFSGICFGFFFLH